jgi:pyridoxamine 5'-phosphate oxidase
MEDLSSMRKEYTQFSLNLEDLNEDPIVQFDNWFSAAKEAKLIEPNAFTLSTVGLDLKPTSRTVLLKMYSKEGFVFFSNYTSVKAKQIEENPNVAAHFAWLGLERQVRIEGSIEKISTAQSLKYFLSRPKESQIGAWVSNQSQVVDSKSVLKAKFENLKEKFLNKQVPLPDFWGGYIIKPEKIEFWQGGKNRLHDRFLYTKVESSWKIERLCP